MNPAAIRKKLLAWYRKNGRSLPWRGDADPYRVWISEVMLQQTQVDTVIPYYTRWMPRFPDLAALAAAQEQDVLQVWEGLGYYSRARNILRCAKVLVNDHAGQLPRDVRQWKPCRASAPISRGRSHPSHSASRRPRWTAT